MYEKPPAPQLNRRCAQTFTSKRAFVTAWVKGILHESDKKAPVVLNNTAVSQ